MAGQRSSFAKQENSHTAFSMNVEKGAGVDLRRISGAVLVVLSLRGLLSLWVLAVSAYQPNTNLHQFIFSNVGTGWRDNWLQQLFVLPWIHYDAWNYWRIAEHGYRVSEGTPAFHPFYPLMSSMLAFVLGGNTALALLVVSTLATIALCIVLAHYVDRFHGHFLAQRSCWMLLLCPIGFILLLPYSESVFMAFAVGSMWSMRNERWWVAGLLGGCAALTRQQGIVLLLPLAWGLWVAIRGHKAYWWHLGALLLIPCCYGAFILYRAVVLGDFIVLSHDSTLIGNLFRVLVSPSAERVAVGQRPAWPWEPLIDQLHRISVTSNNYYMVIDMVLGWLMVLVVFVGLRGMHTQERLYCLGIVMLSICYYNGVLEPYMALPRHMLLAFPMFITLARWTSRRLTMQIVIEVGMLAHLFLLSAFVLDAWIP